MAKANKSKKTVPIYCSQCSAGPDLMKVEVEDGVATRVVSNFDIEEEHPGGGRVCVKAYGLIQKTYNPNRVKQPMKRTNPNKGRHEDPGFVPITWDEAFGIVGEKMRKLRSKGLLNEEGFPRLAITTGGGGTPVQYMGSFPAFMGAWGKIDQGYGAGQGVKCAHSEHLYGELWHRGFIVTADVPKTNYIISCGLNSDASGGVVGLWREADARDRGVRRVQVEPNMSITGAVAAEWVPIKPKTDAAFLYALINRIIVERPIEETCDLPFLKKRTNSPYLIGPNGWFLRDPESGKPLIWDLADGKAKPFDSDIGDAAIHGQYNVSGVEHGPEDEKIFHQDVEVKPSFQVLTDEMQSFSANWAESECEIPAETIRRIADDYVANACIGEFTEVDGQKVPFRPVAVVLGKGTNNGWGAYSCCWARTMLASLVGALEVPGGTLGTAVKMFRPARTRIGSVVAGEDGFLKYVFNPTSAKDWKRNPSIRNAYETLIPHLTESPWAPALGPAHLPWLFQKETPKNWLRTAPPDIWICYRTNPSISSWNAHEVGQRIAEFPFTVAIAYTMDETNHYADILLPESTDLESTQLIRIGGTKFSQNFWHHEGWAIRQKVVEPLYDTMDMSDISLRLAQEVGIVEDYIEAINNGAAGSRLAREGKYDFSLPKDDPPSSDQVWDSLCKAVSWDMSEGKEVHDLAWFQEHGFMLTDFDEINWYIYPEMERQDLRFEMPYQERLTRHGRQLAHRLKEIGVDWWQEQLKEYEFLPAYYSFSDIWENYAAEFGQDPKDYPFWALTSRSMQYSWGANVGIPMINEMAQNIVGHNGVILNRSSARELGITDGDDIVVESVVGTTEGKAVLREGIRPDSILMIGQFGHWKTPVAKDFGLANLNFVTDISLKLTDNTGSGADLMRVRVYKASERSRYENKVAQ
ncbi:MAG: molybdopterin-dependent oxidoreductase [Rhodospirillaceae bacterium]|jgi:phenylacetyl-CoA:acceptor oxidoreductase|nr:molybdopterin-dependent oxidoreductase [Rhodospirillaceae bacterium]MBT5244445.1 molybdopterin-dependent oxidoreductase [Rhodospirillaceae bacterium]MBT5561388.1 molybdopterin-dependent oxidoreductase [Rhodospirillaceae bacterium]MBT6242027.1 molybdopterin-dependent oxidoreductase [Rhodospirillaceae bacterium]MBT7136729.1 molybdopterin-dependent oxidoreductase [Rhodospirillaceae bacterium]